MAPRRSVPDDQGTEALALAGGRPGWGCARRSRPEAAGQEGGQASASQAAEAADPRASCDDHGQAGELQRRERRGDALGRTSEAQRIEQQSGEFAPTDDQRTAVERRLHEGATVSALAREFKTSRNTIMRVRDANACAVTRLRATRP